MNSDPQQPRDATPGRTIAVVTGSRSEYALLKPVMERIRHEPALALQVVTAGMHLDDAFGRTESQITDDGFALAGRVRMSPAGDAPSHMADAVGLGIRNFASEFDRLAPDIVLVLGDRTEAFAAAIAAALSGRVLAHIHGGDRTRGGFDESMRHAITKLAHLHFAATETSRRRIIAMGEREEYVWNTGAPGVDVLLNTPRLSRDQLAHELGLTLQPNFILCVQHPVSTQADLAAEQMRATLNALETLNTQTLLVYPNNDAGGRRMIAVIESYADHPWLHTFRSLPSPVYVSLLAECATLIGNSSSGIIEAPVLGTPVVNLGIRQDGRERAHNVIDVGHDPAQIAAALRKAQTDETFRDRLAKCLHPYGDGHAAEAIVSHLRDVAIDDKLLTKQITC